LDVVGLLLLILGIGSLQIMLEQGERKDWFQSREIVALALVSAVSLVGFVWHELTTRDPVVDLRILKSRQLAAGARFGAALARRSTAPCSRYRSTFRRCSASTANQTGLVILPGALASAVTMAVAGRNAQRIQSATLGG